MNSLVIVFLLTWAAAPRADRANECLLPSSEALLVGLGELGQICPSHQLCPQVLNGQGQSQTQYWQTKTPTSPFWPVERRVLWEVMTLSDSDHEMQLPVGVNCA